MTNHDNVGRLPEPEFGEWIRGNFASEENPQRDGMYVRTIRRSGFTNPGKWYELTDGKGKFWQYLASETTRLCRAAPAGGDEEADKCSWCGRPRSSNALSHDSRCRVRTHPQSEIARRELAYRESVSAPAGSGEVGALIEALSMAFPDDSASAAKAFTAMSPLLPKLQQGADYVLVPRGPTETMLVAGLREANPLGELIDWQPGVSTVEDPTTREDLASVYRAMLRAASQDQEGGNG